jgi:hypothetical protein
MLGRARSAKWGDAFVFKIIDQVGIVPADEESPMLKIASQ